MDPAADLLDRYFAMWNAPDPATRHRLIPQVWTSDALYVDPRARALGHAEIESMVDEVRQSAPHLSFRRVGPALMHHEFVWYAWEMFGADRSVIGGGVSFAEIEDGRLRRLVGFFDREPEPDVAPRVSEHRSRPRS